MKGCRSPRRTWFECIEFDPEDSGTLAIATGGKGARYVKLETSEICLSSNRGESWPALDHLPNICSLALQ